MAKLKEFDSLPAELTAEIIIRGALALEQGESEKVLRLLKKGLEKKIAQKTISNRVALEFKQLWKKLEEEMKKEEFVEKVRTAIERYNARRQEKAALAKKHDRDNPPLMKFSWAAEKKAQLEYRAYGDSWGRHGTFSNFEDAVKFLERYPVKTFRVVIVGYCVEELFIFHSSTGRSEYLFKE